MRETKKVGKKNAQMKLVFGEIAEPGFNLEQVVEELGLELQALQAQPVYW